MRDTPPSDSEATGAKYVSGREGLLNMVSAPVREALLALGTHRHVAKRQIVYHQGDLLDEFYCILSGTVQLTFLRPDGRELVFAAYGSGSTLGLTTILDLEPLPHTAEAVTNTELCVIRRGTFDTLRSEYREIDVAMLRLLSHHIRTLSDYVIGATLDMLERRLIRLLLDLAEEAADGSFRILQSQSELSLMLGVSRQAINRQLRRFERDGLVTLHYGAVSLDDLRALRRRVLVQE